MLKQRIITALILAPVAIAGIFFLPPIGFAVFIGMVLTIGGWEWANLAGFEDRLRYVYAALIALLMGLYSYFQPPAELVLIMGSLWWCLALFFVVQYPARARLWSSRTAISLIGVLCLLPSYAGLLTLKQSADSSFLILLLFFLIWGADIGAYFSGRAFGRRKLAVAVSPGKSWEGFFGGLLTATVIAVLMLLWLGKPDLQSSRGMIFLAGCVLVVMISVLGDLVESMFKRNRGIKDSSGLLPGHGGVLDRVDSLLSAAPVFALMVIEYEWV